MTKIKETNLEEIRGLRDVSFKGIMYRNEDILRSVLSETFEEKVGSIKYLNVELSITRFLEKGRRLDLYLEDEKSFVDIEVSDNYNITIVNRNVGNMAKLYTDTINIGDDYTEYKTVKIVNLIGNKRSDIAKRTYYLKDGKGKVLTKKLIYSEIYIQNLVDMWYNKNEEEILKNRHLIMLGLNLKELKQFNKEYGDDIVAKYTDEFEKMLDNLVFEPLFDKEEDERRIRNSLRKEGKIEGKIEEKKAIAKNLLVNNVSLDIILQSTGLSIEEIEKLRETKND